MACSDDDFRCAGIFQNLYLTRNCATGIDHVVNQNTSTSTDLTYNGLGFCLIWLCQITRLVNECKRRPTETFCPLFSDAYATCIRGHHGDVVDIDTPADMLSRDGEGEEVVHWAVKETLGLRGVQVASPHAVCTGGKLEIRNHTRRNGLTAATFFVLSGIRVKRGYNGDAAGRSTLHRVAEQQLFHDPVVHWCRMCL